MSRLFTLGGQSVGASPSASVLPVNTQGWFLSFRVDWSDLLAVRGTLKSLLQHHNSKTSVLWHIAFFMVQLSHPYMITGKTITLPVRTSVGRVMSLLFHMLSRFVIVFLPGSKGPLISWLQSPSAWFWSPRKQNLSLLPLLLLLFDMKWWDQMSWSWFSECWVLSQSFSLSSFTFNQNLFRFPLFSGIRVVHLHI